MQRIHSIINAPFETLNHVKPWAEEKQFALAQTHPYRGDPLPTLDSFDILFVFGGPQSLFDLHEYEYLQTIMHFLEQAIHANKKIVGFCLGAQLIAQTLGAPIQKSPEKEVGVFPVTLTAAGEQDKLFSQLPTLFTAIHWHYDMPGLPQGAELLAQSEGCPVQAFRYGEHVYGIQFHLEPTKDSIKNMMQHCAADLNPSRFTQNPDAILAADFITMHQLLRRLLDALVK